MKKMIFAVVLLSFAIVAGACSDSSSSDSEESGKLQFFVSGDTVEGLALTIMSERYTVETGVEVEVVDVPYSDMVTKITNMVRSGEPPALARVTGFSPAWNGHLLDLTDIADQNNVDKELGITVDGQLLAPPLDLTAVGMFINKDLFDEAGVSYPTSEDDIWTWAEFIESLETVLEKTDARYGLVMDGSEHRLNALLYQFGSDGFYEENGEYTTNPETRDGLEYFLRLNDNTIMPASVWTTGEDASSMFQSGRVAAYMSGSWQITDFTNNIKDFQWEAVYMPYRTQRATNLGGNYLVAFAGSNVEEEAIQFIDWLYTKENYEKLAELGGYLPVVEGAEINYKLRPEVYELYRNEIDASAPVAGLQRNEQVIKQLISERSASNVIREAIVKTLNDEQSLDEALEEMKRNFTEAYAEGK
ncbi:alpha-1,4-digalacturonate transport system substrate-binding protein [Evansella caseinilytica]|uniref:Alpha-1,4-digalacturonate transport system substrate-binding protein n=1 Tax=Evansella caseinilytica TaxID=1503961 RepID=A0A1H3UTY7_9BACI|nr:sugar ABC transporter substrate-binding protein [Evansella caseinilytica]SDZ65864.1 alpha-1,4-digalacturonate transport system substrate-binding protein [Evansella caseinilytica]